MKTSAQELFLQANQCYAKKEYKDAENLYKKIPQKSAAVWYNLGNCAYKNGDNLHALLYWKRANALGNTTLKAHSEYNSSVVAHKLNITMHTPSRVQSVPVIAVQILFFCIFSIFLVTNAKLWRAKRFIMLGAMSMLMLSAGMITYASYRAHASVQAIVMHDESTLFVGPDAQYHQIAQLTAGDQLQVIGRKADWTKVAYAGSTGWIENNKIEII